MKSRIYNMGTILLVCSKVSNTCQLDKYQHQLTQFMPLSCFFSKLSLWANRTISNNLKNIGNSTPDISKTETPPLKTN